MRLNNNKEQSNNFHLISTKIIKWIKKMNIVIININLIKNQRINGKCNYCKKIRHYFFKNKLRKNQLYLFEYKKYNYRKNNK